MEFTLFYRGLIKSKASIQEKHDLRMCFARQLARLCKLPPLSEHRDWFRKDSFLSLPVAGRTFYFLVARRLDMYAQLHIDVLVPPRSRGFRDIDNKLKVICDALSVPKKAQIPGSARQGRAVHCLLEDDELVYGLTVDTDYLLESGKPSLLDRKTIWIIHVALKGNRFHNKHKDLIV